MDFDFVNVRDFAHALFKFLKNDRPFVLVRRGKPFKLVTPIGAHELAQLSKRQQVSKILSHPACGLWSKRWPKRKASVRIVKDLRHTEENRS